MSRTVSVRPYSTRDWDYQAAGRKAARTRKAKSSAKKRMMGLI